MSGHATSAGSRLTTDDRRTLIATARTVVAQLLIRVPGTSETALRNAWEASCSELARRQMWEGLEDDLHKDRLAVG